MSNDRKQKVIDNDGVMHLKRSMVGSLKTEQILYQYDMIGKKLQEDRLVRIDEINRYGEKIELFTEWVEGRTLESILSQVSDQEAYNLGVRSAQLLNNIHKIGKAVLEDCVTEAFFDQQVMNYRDYFSQDTLYRFVYDNKMLLLYAPDATFLHSDYHVGNIILSDYGNLVLVDLEKCETGTFYRDLGLNETYNYDISPFYAEGLLTEYSKREDFSWNRYGVNMAFFMLVYRNWMYKRRMDSSKVLHQYYKRHNLELYGEPIWIK